MKILSMLFGLVSVVLILNYLGIFNPRSINIVGSTIRTPNNYFLTSVTKNYNNINLNYKDKLQNNVNVLSIEDIQPDCSSLTIEAIYKNYWDTKVILSITSRRIKPSGSFKNFLIKENFETNKTKILDKCFINENGKEVEYKYDILQIDKEILQIIYIVGNDKITIEKIINDICIP